MVVAIPAILASGNAVGSWKLVAREVACASYVFFAWKKACCAVIKAAKAG